MNTSQVSLSSVSRLGLGTGTLGTLGKCASSSQVSGLLDTMVEHDITVIDTADSYGSGQAERLLGRAMRGRRDRFFLMTKAGYRDGNLPWPLGILNPFVKKALHRTGRRQCFDPGYLERCLIRSLRRLCTDHVDVFFLHDPSLEDLKRLDGLEQIKHLRTNGMTSELGVSSGDPTVIREALASGIIGFIQTPANLVDATALNGCWDECARQGLTIIANHVMGPGNYGCPELTREIMMRAASALLPEKAVILCGTRNPDHLVQSDGWVREPLEKDAAIQMMENVRRARN
jgi:pyridoxine 4-dehydrogenase